jgi:hypothetical protein
MKRTVKHNILDRFYYKQFNFLAMKRTVLTVVLIVAMSFAAFARKFVSEGKTFSAIGNYKIEMADNPVTLDGKDLKAFVISYENTDMEVIIAFDKTPKGMKYYVLSDNLSIQYVCNRNFFGVAILDKELEKDGYRTSETALNRGEYFHQKVITTGGNCDLENAKLIAIYYPMLINNFENLLATN